MADFGSRLATNVAGTIIDKVIRKMNDIIHMEENLGDLKSDFTRLEEYLRHIEKQFQEQQRALPELVQNCLGRMHTDLEKAKDLIVRANPRPRCLGCCSLRNPKLSTQIRDWKPRFDRLFKELEGVISTCADAQQIVFGAAPLAEVLRQPVQESGFEGSTIKSDQMKLQTWLGEDHPQARRIGVYGMGGVGKTSLLKLVYNHFKEVSGTFDVKIWLTVSKEYQIEKLQTSIAETLNLNLKGISDNDLRKMKLSDFLGNKKFLLILDDVWRPINVIEELGVKFGDHNCSKVLISSRSREVIFAMEASEDYALKIKPLSPEEGWELFRTRAFANGVVPDDIEATAREIASECQGLPLALNAVGRAMRRKQTAVEWRRAFTLMTSADRSFQASNSTIDKELYGRLKWSYDDLPNPELKICFLYCAVFPEDAEIPVETLVEMWRAEKLVTRMDAGHEYIDVLVDRGLFEYVAAGDEIIKRLHPYRHEEKRVKIHDVLRDLAIYIGKSENWFFATGQQRQDFPSEDDIRDCKRISVGHNDIRDLPTDLICSKLVSLVLASNRISKVPERFLSSAMSLKVLDLSVTFIRSLPTSLGQLGQLEFLRLTNCYFLQDLPESIGNLSHLRFLNLQDCESLGPLPDSIGELRNLKHLNLQGCRRTEIPRGISSLTSLNKLFLELTPGAWTWRIVHVKDIANLSNLMELSAVVRAEINESTITKWTDLRRLKVRFASTCFSYDADGDDVMEDIFPLNMENMKKLEDFTLLYYGGVSLPNCISQFPRLKTLELYNLNRLESMVGSSVVSSEETMPVLEEITIRYCSSLKRLGTKKLLRLKRLSIEYCSEFEALEIESAGLPMLEYLRLEDLRKCQFIVGPSGVINDGVMPKLEVLRVKFCGLLKLGLEKLPNLRSILIVGCEKLRELKMGSDGFPVLESLTLVNCVNLENIVGSLDVWNDKTMPNLKSLMIANCPLLRTLPRGIDKLSNLKEITGNLKWWQELIWEDENVKNNLSLIFKE